MVEWLTRELDLGAGRVVVDLAAGTGKLTRLLEPTGARVIAVEPVPEMLAVLRRTSPAVAALRALAEALPLADRSVDAVTVAQAFHWFDRDRTLAELARVVRAGGAVALVWNARDRSVPWVDALWSVMDRVEKQAPWRDHDRRDHGPGEHPAFEAPASVELRNLQTVSLDGLVRRFSSVSHVAVLPATERAAVLEEVAAIGRAEMVRTDSDRLAIPYRVDATLLRRV